MRLAAVIRHDIRLQVRHGLYTVYLVVCLLYLLILRSLPDGARSVLLPVLIFSDPAMLGFFFVGGMVLLERGDRTLSGLFTTPLRWQTYFAARIASLTLLALLAGFFLAVAVRGVRFRPLLLLAGIALTSTVFTLIGLTAAARFRTVNHYLIGSVAYMLPFALPLLEVFGLFSSPLLYLLPTRGSIVLIVGAFAEQAPGTWSLVASFTSLALWAALGWAWAGRWFVRHILAGIGGEV